MYEMKKFYLIKFCGAKSSSDTNNVDAFDFDIVDDSVVEYVLL